MKIMNFDLYRLYDNKDNIKLMHIEEDPEGRTYYVKIEENNIEDMLSEMMLPDRIKQQLREDIVDVVKGYNALVAYQLYSEEMIALCNKYFSDVLEKFCFEHGTRLFEVRKYEIEI